MFKALPRAVTHRALMRMAFTTPIIEVDGFERPRMPIPELERRFEER